MPTHRPTTGARAAATPQLGPDPNAPRTRWGARALLAAPLVVACLAVALAPGPGQGAPRGALKAGEVPTLESVVAKEGWTPIPSQSGIYKPGNVLVPNPTGGHVLAAADCVDATPQVEVMSESRIASTLKGGVRGNFGAGAAGASAGLVVTQTFVDPEQRTIPLIELKLNSKCLSGLKANAVGIDLEQAVLVHDVLVAIVKSQTCTQAGAEGRFALAGSAQVEASTDCVRESEGQVPVGFKARPVLPFLGQVAVATAPPAGGEAPQSSGKASGRAAKPTRSTAPEAQTPSFDEAAEVARSLEENAAERARLQRELATCVDTKTRDLRAKASADWSKLAPLSGKHDADSKAAATRLFETYVQTYSAATVRCENGSGTRSDGVVIAEVAAARDWLDTPVGGRAGTAWVGKSGYKMRLVPAGTYQVGCSKRDSSCRDHEQPVRQVTITRSTYVGEVEVTQGLWKAVMGTTPWTGKQTDPEGAPLSGDFPLCSIFGNAPNLPATCIDWLGAARMANELSKREGLELCYTITGEQVSWPAGNSCTGYRLPTEAEWEVAALGGGLTAAAIQDPCTVANIANYDRAPKYREKLNIDTWMLTKCDDGHTWLAPGGSRAANGYGIYDMQGNVWEWVWDIPVAFTSTPRTDPTGMDSGDRRAARGGSWSDPGGIARPVSRGINNPKARTGSLGFRLVRTVP